MALGVLFVAGVALLAVALLLAPLFVNRDQEQLDGTLGGVRQLDGPSESELEEIVRDVDRPDDRFLCPRCGAENDPEYRYCGICAADMHPDA
ncbi:MAG: zinc ribbon domain-containing protein [Natronomonas sp.]